MTLPILVYKANGVKSSEGLQVRAQRTAGLWQLDSSLASSKAQPSVLRPLFFLSLHPLSCWESPGLWLNLVSLSKLNEVGCMFAGVVSLYSNNSFLLPRSASDRVSVGGGGSVGEQLSLVSMRQPAECQLSFRHLLPDSQREKRARSLPTCRSGNSRLRL